MPYLMVSTAANSRFGPLNPHDDLIHSQCGNRCQVCQGDGGVLSRVSTANAPRTTCNSCSRWTTCRPRVDGSLCRKSPETFLERVGERHTKIAFQIGTHWQESGIPVSLQVSGISQVEWT